MSEHKIAEPNEYFILNNGRVLKNVFELANSLSSMDDATFSYHVNSDKNDFANWIRGVFEDNGLADKVQKAGDKEEIAKVINQTFKKPEKKEKRKPIIKKLIQKKEPAKKEDSSTLAPKEIQKFPIEKKENDKELTKKIDEIVIKEKEIEKREEKIQEIEERIERELQAQKESKLKPDEGFFSKEFLQGLATGFLVTLILALTYIKFFMNV